MKGREVTWDKEGGENNTNNIRRTSPLAAVALRASFFLSSAAHMASILDTFDASPCVVVVVVLVSARADMLDKNK